MKEIWELIVEFAKSSGIAQFFVEGGYKYLIMICVALVLMFLAIKKGFEPYLLLPIAFGMLLINLPAVKDEVFKEVVNYTMSYNGQILTFENLTQAEEFLATLPTDLQGLEIVANKSYSGLIGYLYYGVKLGIYPCLIFLCIGATTDFGPLIANKKTMLLGAAAQLGIFLTFL